MMALSQRGILILCLSALLTFSLFAVYVSSQPVPEEGGNLMEDLEPLPEDRELPLEEEIFDGQSEIPEEAE